MLCVALLAAVLAAEPAVVDAIHISGNSRTLEPVIRDELRTRAGGPFVPARWAADEQAVKDLGFFWSTAATAAVRDGRASLYLRVREKWTLLPIVQYTKTRDAYQLTLGAWDTNFLGYGVESGVKLVRKRAGTNYDVWVSQPRIGSGSQYYKIEFQSGERQIFDYGRRRADIAPQAEFTEARTAADIEYGRRLDDAGTKRAGLYYGPYATQYAGSPGAPASRIAHRLGLKASLGRVHYDDYVYTGGRLDASAWESLSPGDPSVFAHWEAAYRQFWSPLPRHNVALRAVAGGTGSERIEDAFFMGGLDEVRGFPDQRFHGRYAAYANVEYRVPAIDNQWVLVQAVALSDGSTVWNGIQAHERPQSAWAAGAGIHALVKPVHRLVVRFDAVRAFEPFARNEFSLGFKEFIDVL